MSLERSGSGQGLAQEENFSWDYIKHAPARDSKGPLGHHTSHVRSSLDWDFNNDTPLAATRRSKEYGEHDQGFKPRVPS